MIVGGASSAWADETYSFTPDQSSTGSGATSYITTLTEFTYNKISWKMNQWNPKTLQVKTNQSSAASEFRFYNTSAFPERIKQVVITFSALTVSDASKLMFLGGTSEVTATTGGTAGTWNSTTKTLTWTPGSSDNYTYFAFYQNGKAASGTNYLASSNAIVVTYESAASVTALSVKTAPTKTRYEVGESLDMTGFVLDADGTEITSGYTMTMGGSSITNGATLSSAGKKTITVSYGGKTVDQAISVGAVTSIYVTTPPTKTSYDTGDSFDPTGMVVTASLSTGELSEPDTWTKTVTGYTVSPENDLAPANTSVTITYAEKTATQAITVTNVAVTGVSVKASTTIEKSKTETLTPTFTPSNATNKTVTWNSDNTSVATVTAGVVTAVAAGTANITVTTEDGGKTATCVVTVVNAKGSADYPYTVAEVISGAATGNDKYVIGYIVGCYKSGNKSNFGRNGDTDTNLAIADDPDEDDVANTIAVQLPSGDIRTNFNVSTYPHYIGATKIVVYADITSYITTKGLKNTESINAVSELVTVSNADFATYVSNFGLDYSGLGVKAYKAKVSSKGVAKLTKVDKVPAKTPVLLYKDGGATEVIPVIASADAVSDNDLVAGTGAAVPTTDGAGNTNMILNVVDDQIGFYFANAQTVAKNRAYLHVATSLAPDAAASRMVMVFADETTGISSLTPNLSTKGEGSVYTLSGQRVEKPTKGLYIVNGKKVIIK